MAHHALRLLLVPVVATAILAGCADRPEEALGDDDLPLGPIDDPGPMDPASPPPDGDDMGATNDTGGMPNGTIDTGDANMTMDDAGPMLPSAP